MLTIYFWATEFGSSSGFLVGDSWTGTITNQTLHRTVSILYCLTSNLLCLLFYGSQKCWLCDLCLMTLIYFFSSMHKYHHAISVSQNLSTFRVTENRSTSDSYILQRILWLVNHCIVERWSKGDGCCALTFWISLSLIFEYNNFRAILRLNGYNIIESVQGTWTYFISAHWVPSITLDELWQF